MLVVWLIRPGELEKKVRSTTHRQIPEPAAKSLGEPLRIDRIFWPTSLTHLSSYLLRASRRWRTISAVQPSTFLLPVCTPAFCSPVHPQVREVSR